MHQPNDVQFATTHLSTGPRLHYAERGDREGEAIIFLHGYSDSWYSFSRVLPLLSPEYRAFALTQRGHGDSDKPECCYTPYDFAADVDAIMDVVGIEEATLVGASTGALFAQRVVLSYPRRVNRLVLIGAQTPVNEAVSGLREEMQALEDPVPPEFVREFQRAPFTSRFRKSSSIRWSQRASSSRPEYGAIIWSRRCFRSIMIM
jgi:non-heme chloroperoxidase